MYSCYMKTACNLKTIKTKTKHCNFFKHHSKRMLVLEDNGDFMFKVVVIKYGVTFYCTVKYRFILYRLP